MVDIIWFVHLVALKQRSGLIYDVFLWLLRRVVHAMSYSCRHSGLGMINLASYIKDHCSLVDLISDDTKLKKTGHNRLSGLCVFHHEKSPSLTVDAEHQTYKCFGCNASGDAISYVRALNSCDFWEACKILVQRFNIPEPERIRRKAIRDQIREAEINKQFDIAQKLLVQL